MLSEPDADFDLILCDIMMPELTGADVYQRVARARQELAEKFVFMSGGAFTSDTRQFLASTAAPLLDKPFRIDEVRALLNAQLGRASTQSS